ncbi:peptidylprolyl isomerase [Paracoccus onubensis]|uniref:peptidylprolyl isomerase n=1 Tax=Paracoccus onubensis TaxID=1675788 RepID=UPI00272FFA58|nr:peptidylprolyl isomerase [Paracoccus onubensis]MDP0927107.1 peptidylprolyl isomerase [Paracoccus onubensis]
MLKHSILAAFVIAAPAALPVAALAQDNNAEPAQNSEAEPAQNEAAPAESSEAEPAQDSEAATTQDGDAETVVATVNDQTITLGQMIVMKQSVQDNPQMQDLPDQAMWDVLLDELIRQAAVSASGKETASVRAQLELQRRSALASEAVEGLSQAEPTDEELQASYDKLFADAEPQTEYSAAHILVDSEEKALEVKKKLDDGGEFGELAEEYSTGPSGPNQGDLGWFTADQMVPAFSEAVAAMEAGQISDPIKTDFGWHVIKLNDTRVKEAPKLEEVRDQLVQLVQREKIEGEIERLTSEADIEKTEGIDPTLINKVELLEAE